MAFTVADAEDEVNKELYVALMKQETDNVLQICERFPEGPLHVITIHNDTVLHMVVYCNQVDLVLRLLEKVPKNHLDMMKHKNKVGNTILHEAATNYHMVPAVRKMIQMAPELLHITNIYGFTPLYRSVFYGQVVMFKFLDEFVRKEKHVERDQEADRELYYHKTNKTTVLHTAIAIESYDLALFIAKKYEHLVVERDREGMTALQLLATKSSTFKNRGRRYHKQLVYTSASTQECSNVTGYWRFPYWEKKKKEKETYESALSLAEFLVTKDKSWMATKAMEDQNQPTCHNYRADPSSSASLQGEIKNEQKPPASTRTSSGWAAETPLFLATRHGCVEIVKKILEEYPWAVEHIDDQGRTILHRAIQYREMDILNLVEKMGIPMRRLERKFDNNFNSILHVVGENKENGIFTEGLSPALQLRENLIFFERVMDMCPDHLLMQMNSEKKTAEQLFVSRNEGLRKQAKDWMKQTSEQCSLVAVLIATVAFAAAYTVPGGANQNTGVPILLDQPFFVIFTITDVLSLTFALTSVIVFLQILTSSYRLKDFKQSLPQYLMLGVTCLILSVSMMMVAFAATVILMVNNRDQWKKIALYAAAFLPVIIFALLNLRLYLTLMKTFDYPLKKLAKVFPQFHGDSVLSWAVNSIYTSKSKTTISYKSNQDETSGPTCSPRSLV